MMVKEKKSDVIKKRAIEHGILFIKRGATVRTIAKLTGHSKSTVHLDLYRLEEIHPYLFQKVKEKLNYHLAVRHFRGGETIRKRAEKKKNNGVRKEDENDSK